MSPNVLTFLLGLSLALFWSNAEAQKDLQMGRLSTSGLSAGGFMAAQLHVAFSSVVNGSAIFAGGPYYCAQNSETTALTACMSAPLLLNVAQLVSLTKGFENSGDIDSLANLNNQRVYLYSGTGDTVVSPAVVKALQEMYNDLATNMHVSTQYDIDSEHCLPTLDYGNSCTFLGSPYISKCNYDGAGSALQALYDGSLSPPVAQVSENIVQLDQLQFVPAGKSTTGLAANAFAYVPTGCRNNTRSACDIHIVWHGCNQSYTVKGVGSDFYTNGGYNGWAEANNIIMLYPQSTAVFLKNPQGCFDWWGYSGSDYAFKTSSQMQTALNMAASLFNTSSTSI